LSETADQLRRNLHDESPREVRGAVDGGGLIPWLQLISVRHAPSDAEQRERRGPKAVFTRLVAVEVVDEKRAGGVGSWTIGSDGAWVPAGGEPELLQRLWAERQRRNRGPSRFATRRAEVRALTEESRERARRAQVAAAAGDLRRTSRNAKCPCGSEKKFKLCCGA